MKRREFLNKSCMGLAGITLLRMTDSNLLSPEKTPPSEKMRYRILGKTGLKMSVLGFGAMITPDAQMLYRAIREYGVNNVDTARGYQGGQNEDLVARGIGDKRKEVFITTKFGLRNDKKRIIDSVETSLKHLKTDYIDIILLHGGRSKEDIMNPAVLEAITQLKKDGKVIFCGTSTHRNEIETVRAVTESNFYDVVLVKYNFKSPPELTEAIAEANANGIGVIAMKTTAKLRNLAAEKEINTYQATLRWVLDNPNVAVAIPSTKSFEELEDNYKAVMAHSSGGDGKTLHRYGRVLEGEYCRWCGECEIGCSHGVAVSEINRALMYAEGYEEPVLAASTYASISSGSNLSQCKECPHCTVQCPYDVNVKEKLQRASALFA